MNTLKSVVVLAVLGIVGYGLYVGLNNGFQFQGGGTETPDWILAQTDGSPEAPAVEFGDAAQPGTTPGEPPRLALTYGNEQTAPPATAPPATAQVGTPIAITPQPTYPAGSIPGGGAAPIGTVPPGAPSSAPAPAAMAPNTAWPPVAAPTATLPAESTLAASQATNVQAIPPTAVVPVDLPPLANAPADMQRPNPTTPIGTDTSGATTTGPSGQFGATQTVQPFAPQENATAAPGQSTSGFQAALATAKDQLAKGQLAAALMTLSIYYDDIRLDAQQQQELVSILDQVAGTVIYSQKHLLEAPYRVRAGEKLEDIAKQYKVPEGLLAKINGITNPDALVAGQELKVVRGPFRAEINSNKRQLVLWVGGRYAGRFNVAVGPEFQQIVGPFVVKSKTRQHVGNDGYPWIELGPGFRSTAPKEGGPRLGIAGMTNPSEAARGAVPGRIGVTEQDAQDLFDILSQGSQVTIRR